MMKVYLKWSDLAKGGTSDKKWLPVSALQCAKQKKASHKKWLFSLPMGVNVRSLRKYLNLVYLGYNWWDSNTEFKMYLCCLGLQGSDHHEGSTERGADRPQPAQEEIWCPLHALPSDPPQNYRSQSVRWLSTDLVLHAFVSLITPDGLLKVDFSSLFFRLRQRWERWWERRPSLWLKPNLQPETSGKNQRNIMWCDVWCRCICNSHL